MVVEMYKVVSSNYNHILVYFPKNRKVSYIKKRIKEILVNNIYFKKFKKYKFIIYLVEYKKNKRFHFNKEDKPYKIKENIINEFII